MLGVCAKPDVEVLLGSAEARVRELQLLCEETSQRIHSAKAAAQRWRQIAITLLASGLVPFHPGPPHRMPELMQLLSAQELDEAKLLTATLCKQFQLRQRVVALREECYSLAEQEHLVETQLESQKDFQEQLREDIAIETSKRKNKMTGNPAETTEGLPGTEFSTETAKRYSVREQFAELEFVGGNLQLESADLLVSEQESLAETRTLEQDIRSLDERIRLLGQGYQTQRHQAEHLSNSLMLQHCQIASTLRDIQEVRAICDWHDSDARDSTTVLVEEVDDFENSFRSQSN